MMVFPSPKKSKRVSFWVVLITLFGFVCYFSVMIYFKFVYSRPPTPTEISVEIPSWQNYIPEDFPRDKVILFSEYLNDPSVLNLELGNGPLAVHYDDFIKYAPPNHTNFDNEIHTTLVGFMILRSCYDQTGEWPSAFVMYLYGPYFLQSKRPQDLVKIQELMKYLGYQ